MLANNKNKFDYVFNKLQEAVAKKLGKESTTNFGSLLKIARDRNDKVIMTYIDRLDFYREFRNILIHNSISEYESIATPSDSLINDIIDITEKILYPKKVKDLFIRPVISFTKTDTLSSVLEAVKVNRYSQFPVFEENKLIGIISKNGITNFLANAVEGDTISIKETTVEQVMKADESLRSYQVIPENKSIFDIGFIFSKKINEGKTSYLLLISKDGEIKSDKDIIGIITPWDIPIIVENI